LVIIPRIDTSDMPWNGRIKGCQTIQAREGGQDNDAKKKKARKSVNVN